MNDWEEQVELRDEGGMKIKSKKIKLIVFFREQSKIWENCETKVFFGIGITIHFSSHADDVASEEDERVECAIKFVTLYLPFIQLRIYAAIKTQEHDDDDGRKVVGWKIEWKKTLNMHFMFLQINFRNFIAI